MCCFTSEVNEVSDTSIFARVDDLGFQYLVYQMKVDTPEDVAMVLPVPVRPALGAGGLEFVDFAGYPDFFEDMNLAFPPPASYGLSYVSAAPVPSPTLKVHKVGNFIASFVPSLADFDRLDERLRLPAGTWEKVPMYQQSGFGFAVFKLRKGRTKVHPMALRFQTSNRMKLFFPTVHIHDGEIHEYEQFDHSLYCQGNYKELADAWSESPSLANTTIDLKKSKDFIAGDAHLFRRKINGFKANKDVILNLG